MWKLYSIQNQDIHPVTQQTTDESVQRITIGPSIAIFPEGVHSQGIILCIFEEHYANPLICRTNARHKMVQS